MAVFVAVVAVVSILASLVISSVLGSMPAGAGASGTDGPGGTVSVGAFGGGSQPGGPGSGGGGAGGSGSGAGGPWICTDTPLTLNDASQPPGGNPAGVEAAMSELVRLVADDIEPFDSVHPSTLELYRTLTRRRNRRFPPQVVGDSRTT